MPIVSKQLNSILQEVTLKDAPPGASFIKEGDCMNSYVNPKELEPACFYLRKSREDHEAEARGEGETLAKHKNALLKLAKEYGVTISNIYQEVVSGESIIHRPVVIELLKAVEHGIWKSVWCMDIDRLGRGKMQDQGLIIDTFKNSHTKIVTPRKIYDLDNDLDEEYTEFEAFMARKELKIITRRLQGGRIRSLEEGNYLGSIPPYGYLIDKNNRKRRLLKHPEQKETTDFIFSMYRTGNMGANKIANELNQLGFLSYTGKRWTAASILNMLKNPVYCGNTVWKKKEIKKSAIPGKKKETRSRSREEQIWIYNTHEAYITEEEFTQIQEKLAKKHHSPHQRAISNPLAGLVKCAICGTSMIYRPYTHQQYPHLMCYNKHCPNKSSRFEFVEEKLLRALSIWLEHYCMQWNTNLPCDNNSSILNLKIKALSNLRKELKELEFQTDRLYELLERNIYDEEIYQSRSKKLANRIKEIQEAIAQADNSLNACTESTSVQTIMPATKSLLQAYSIVSDPAVKNQMLKYLLDFATYRKDKHQHGDEFTLILYPRLPHGSAHINHER